jgi:hypothetical protein
MITSTRRAPYTLPKRDVVFVGPETICVKIPDDVVIPERFVPLQATPIIGRSVFLGDARDASNARGLKDVGITHIVSCCPEFGETIRPVEGVTYLRICIADTRDAQISTHFDVVYRFIENALLEDQNSKILVHCAAGISRSATLVISFLMRYFSIKFDVALEAVCELRDKVWPNFGFQRQLREFEDTLFQV